MPFHLTCQSGQTGGVLWASVGAPVGMLANRAQRPPMNPTQSVESRRSAAARRSLALGEPWVPTVGEVQWTSAEVNAQF